MKTSEIAMKLLRWEQLQQAAEELAKDIRAAVMALGKTQSAGSVRATYSNGRKRFLYKEAALSDGRCDDAFIQAHSISIVSWRGICADLGLDVDFTKSEPTVRLRVVRE